MKPDISSLSPLPPDPSKPCHLPSNTVAILNSDIRWPVTYKEQDYFLQPDGSIIRVTPEDYKDPEKRKYPDAMPLIWEAWLYGPASDIATLKIGAATVIAATGLKGSGKSSTLALLTAKALAAGMPVWSNMGVKFYLVRQDGSLIFLQTLPLDWEAVLILSKELRGGALVIDELSYYASSRLSSSVRNRIINAAVNQVRKRALDFYTSVKWLRQIDVNIREELDCHISCEDYALSARGQEMHLDKGCIIKQQYRDISGWSGQPISRVNHTSRKELGFIPIDNFDPLGEPIYKDAGQTMEFQSRFTWPLYNSYEVVDTATAFQKVRLDLEEIVISNKQQSEVIEGTISEVVDMFQSEGNIKVECDVFRETVERAGIHLEERQLGKILKNNFGITRKRFNRGNFYIMGEE